MSQANPLWGAPRVHGELLKLGIAVAQSTVAKYLPRPRKPPSQTWRTFLTNHLMQTAAIDFFHRADGDLPGPVRLRVLSHERRRVVHFGVTEHPQRSGTMQQMREAFPWDQAPRYLLRDRDAIYGKDFAAMTRDMGMEEVLTAPRSPWQNPLRNGWWAPSDASAWTTLWWNQRSLRRTLQSYFSYYQSVAYSFSFGQRRAEPRAVEPPAQGAWCRFLRSVDYTTDTCDAPLSRSEPGSSTPAFLDQTFADPKRDSFATRTPAFDALVD